MGSMRGLLQIAIFFSALLAFDRSCFVDAALSNGMYFYWGSQLGRITGWDSCQLLLDQQGGSGITSKASFLYGSLSMRIKLVQGNSAGTVTTFYMSSFGNRHDEIDFEFLGNVSGQPYTIHTNIFTQGFGQREQQFKAWFDPTTDYHNYTIFWNPYEVVWLVDSIPIRVFRNYHDPEINFPDSQAMKVFASLWNADQWATQGGKVKTNWALAPFKAEFQNFETKACFWNGPSTIKRCASKNPANWWTNSIYYRLSYPKLGQMNWVRDKFMIYNYCTDFKRFNGKVPKECYLPQY
ncbi:hypothetical protein Dimus_026565 [Dionaea muscipula]